MPKQGFLLGLLLVVLAPAGLAQPGIIVVGLNVRYDNPADGANAWPQRLPLIRQYMEAVTPDILGVQEALHHQLLDLLEVLPGYDYVGSGRDDGLLGGEFSPVLFREDRFELVRQGQFWLSETPGVPGSIGWEAVLPRVVAWAELRNRSDGQAFYVFNTHFSHVSDLARRFSMELLSAQVHAIAGENPVVLTGDFNIRKGSALYQDMAVHLASKNGLFNAEGVARHAKNGPGATYNAFGKDGDHGTIDFIFVSGHFDVLTFQADEVLHKGVFISDHWPVRTRLLLKN